MKGFWSLWAGIVLSGESVGSLVPGRSFKARTIPRSVGSSGYWLCDFVGFWEAELLGYVSGLVTRSLFRHVYIECPGPEAGP